jgi:hypothetical protein
MNDSISSKFDTFVLRRLAEPVFGREWPAWAWYTLLGFVLAAGFFYVAWMYRRDSAGVGRLWASFLGLLRCTVYVLLAIVFLLPASQSWEETSSHSKVLVLFDVSPSLTKVKDDPNDSLKRTRQDHVFGFLTDEKKGFFKGLEAKNPVALYRFAKGLHDQYLYLNENRLWTREQWEKWVQERKEKPGAELPDLKPLSPELLQTFLFPGQAVKAPEGLPKEEADRFEKLAAENAKLTEAGFFNGTNVGDAVLTGLNREINNMLQGIVVFTDGRSTEGSSQAFRDLEQRAKAAKVPIFVVAVGSDRPKIKLDIADVRIPEQVQPEDKFRGVVEVTGEGLPEQEITVRLHLTYVKKGKNGKDEPLEIELIEAEDKSAPDKERATVSLGKEVVLTAKKKLDRGTPPRMEVEFALDAYSLAKELNKELDPKKKWEIKETKEGEIKVQARVDKKPEEVFEEKEHRSETADLRVIKKPLRVLLFASAPTRDYQFVRTMMVREVEKKRAELTIHLQLPPGATERRMGVVQDVPPDRLLSGFPNRYDQPSDDPTEKLLDLNEYDVIIAFDPDWRQLSDDQLKNVKRWVEKGGGLICIGGPINTLQLARPGEFKGKLKPILDLYPVTLEDVRIDEMDRKTDEPWPLDFKGATPDMEFLKLAEQGDPWLKDKDVAPAFLADWQEFFTGKSADSDRPTGPRRGFFNYYPVKNAKPGALVAARFTDPKARLKDNSEQPFFVLSDPSSGQRVVWIGSGETWRLRQFHETYHERFWTKLARYAATGNQGKTNKRITSYIGRNFVAGQAIPIEAKIDGKGGEPLSKNTKEKPKVTFTPPVGAAEKDVPKKSVDLEPKDPKGTENDGRFVARVQFRAPGEYGYEIKVPETGDSLTGKFTVKPADPEMDDTRPDFEEAYHLASAADEVVLPRMSEADKTLLRGRLQKPQLEQSGDKAGAAEAVKEEKQRLFFTLENADLIPKCMLSNVQTQRSRGKITDFWDDGFVIWNREPPAEPIRLSYVLVAVVGLLSIEWLTRKLLRLA